MDRIRVTRIIARLNIGGPAVHVVNLTAALDPERFESRLVAGRPGPHEGDMGYLAAEKGVTPIVVPELGREISPWRDVRATFKLIRLLRRHRPHVVETHTAKAGTVGRLAARLAGVPVVLHVFHGHVFHSYFGPAKTRLFIAIERALARVSDRIITISPAQRRDVVDVYRIAPPEKVVVIPLGFDLQPFVAAGQRRAGRFRASLGIPPDAPLVGFVGRLTAVKNPLLFVESAPLVLRQVPAAHFAFVGGGELRPQMERRVAELGLRARFSFAGWHDRMPAVYADLDLLALTSLNEGTPVTVIEALAAGVPVVATAVGGVPDVVRDGQTGLLVPPEDPQALARAVAQALREPQAARALAVAGQRDVLARFDLARLTHDMASLYASLLDEKGISPR